MFLQNIITKTGGQYSECFENSDAPFIFDESYTTEACGFFTLYFFLYPIHTFQGCYHYCFQKHANKTCGCVDPRYNLIKKSFYCTVEKSTLVYCINMQISQMSTEFCSRNLS